MKLRRYQRVLRIVAQGACQPLGKCVVIYHGKPNGHACDACLASAALNPRRERSKHLLKTPDVLVALGLKP